MIKNFLTFQDMIEIIKDSVFTESSFFSISLVQV